MPGKCKPYDYMSKRSLSIIITGLLTLFYSWCSAQIFAGNDTIICNSSPVTLTATFSTPSAVPGTQVTLSDDQYSGVVNIGFPFTFFGNTYSQCLISSNNYITFDLSQANSYSPWSITTALPSASNPTNAIMCPWQDLLPPSGGNIEYVTIGTAPNRIFVVSFFSVAMFSCTNLTFCSQIKLYEGTNIIETHIADKPLCTTWNSGYAIHGIQNANGTTAFVVPGRNYPSTWTATNEGYQFIPAGSTAYAQGVIPYNPSYVSSALNNAGWYNAATGALINSGTSITVNPVVTTDYVAVMSYCSGQTFKDTVSVIVGLLNNNYSQVNVSCYGGSNGVTVAQASGPGGPWTYTWNDMSGTQIQQTQNTSSPDSLKGVAAGSYSVTIVNQVGCTGSHTFTVTQPQAPIATSMGLVNDSCSGAPDAVATVVAEGGTPPYSYLWSTLPSQTAGSAANLGAGTYTVTVTDSKGCTQSQTVTVFKDPAPIADFSFSPQVITLFEPLCTFTDLSSNAYTWSWNFGDGDTSLLQNPEHSYTAPGTYPVTLTVTNALGCPGQVVIPVTVEDFYTIYLPNSFTPNEDGKNELFGAYASGIEDASFEIRIFTRWGNQIFSSADIDQWWNGRYNNTGEMVPEAVYVYVVNFKDFKRVSHKLMGHVSVLR
jgi:gliding motility-associated-like protein